jgi:integrase/recombinase XerD
VLAVAYDLKVFFTVVGKSPKRVRPADVLAFMTLNGPFMALPHRPSNRSMVSGWECRRGRCGVGCRASRVCTRFCMSAATWRPTRFRVVCRPAGNETDQDGRSAGPRDPDSTKDPRAVRGRRAHQGPAQPPGPGDGRGDGARWSARRCEAIGLRLSDLRMAERRVFIAEGKGSHQRLVPISTRFLSGRVRPMPPATSCGTPA